jgi:hypothetical protein
MAMADQGPGESSTGTNLTFTQEWTVEQTRERGLFLSDRAWHRTIEKLEACKERGLSELWIAVGGIAAGGALSAAVALETLPALTVRLEKDNLQIILIFCIVVVLLCVLGYFTTREKHNRAIEMVIGDMKASRPYREESMTGGTNP